MKTREDMARELVGYHVAVEQGIVYAAQFQRTGGDRADEPVKLLEVSHATIPAGVSPVYFGANDEFPYPLVIVELTEQEYAALRAGELSLPEGWDLEEPLHQRAA